MEVKTAESLLIEALKQMQINFSRVTIGEPREQISGLCVRLNFQVTFLRSLFHNYLFKFIGQ